MVIINGNPKKKPNKTILSKLRNNCGRITELFVRKILELSYSWIVEKKNHLPDANKPVNCEGLLKQLPTIKVRTYGKNWSDYFHYEDIVEIKKKNIDVLIRCGFGILRGDILNTAKYGIWSFHHGDNLINRGGPAGFWESMENWPETGSILQILSEDLDNGKVLYRSFSCTNNMSVTDNRSNYFWKSLSFMTRKLEELYNVGEEKFFEKVEYENRHPIFYSERLFLQPKNYELAKLTLTKILDKVKIVFENMVYFDQWILMFDIKDKFSSALWRYKKIMPPKDRFWADPHVIYHKNKYFIFIEEYIYEAQKGHISLIIMDKNGIYQKPKAIINKPYHLSYPFVFTYKTEFYMIPETYSNKTIELYKCIEFPWKWEFQMNLMDNGIGGIDTTLMFHKNKWWMFTNLIENEGASPCDELYLFSSEKLISDKWIAHPLNPVISDCKHARSAGKIFAENGRLYRPSQNCSGRYGYGFNLYEIIKLNETDYSEVPVSYVKPNWDKKIIATHTFNREKKLHIIDALYKRKK